MKQMYTDLQLISFFYHESDLFETLEIEHALEENPILRDQYEDLVQELSYLDTLTNTTLSPCKAVVSRIKLYSQLLPY